MQCGFFGGLVWSVEWRWRRDKNLTSSFRPSVRLRLSQRGENLRSPHGEASMKLGHWFITCAAAAAAAADTNVAVVQLNYMLFIRMLSARWLYISFSLMIVCLKIQTICTRMLVTNHFSVTGIAFGRVCVCLSRKMTFERNYTWTRYFACCMVDLYLIQLNSKVTVIRQNSRLQRELKIPSGIWSRLYGLLTQSKICAPRKSEPKNF